MRSPRRSASDEAGKRLEKMFSPEPYDFFTVVEVLDTLREFRSSPSKRKRNVFRCAINKIFGTRKYLPSYSLHKIMKIGHIFGGIIEYGLVSNGKDLDESYNIILDALKMSPESNMFCFGLMALDRIKHFLFEHRKYCCEISMIPHFNVFPPDLLEYIMSVRNQQQIEEIQNPITPVSQKSPKVLKSIRTITPETYKPDTVTSVTVESRTTVAVRSSEPLIAHSVQEERIPVAATKVLCNNQTIIEPSKIVQQKITFIFNNMNEENVKNKCAEVMDNMEPTYFPWLSVFLTKRICTESQLHSLYSTCLECFNSDQLNQLIELETVRNIKVMLEKDRSPQTKRLLKNMGNWLGLITLAKNKPVPFDLEKMVIEAHANSGDELAFILPFVTKTLESCSKSKVYGPKAPWTISMLKCITKFHQTAGLRLFFEYKIDTNILKLRNRPDRN